MMHSSTLKALVLEPLKNDIWSLQIRSNFGTVEIRFEEDIMIIKLHELHSDLGAKLIREGYEVFADPADSSYKISKEREKSRVKSFKKFLKIYKSIEKKIEKQNEEECDDD